MNGHDEVGVLAYEPEFFDDDPPEPIFCKCERCGVEGWEYQHGFSVVGREGGCFEICGACFEKDPELVERRAAVATWLAEQPDPFEDD